MKLLNLLFIVVFLCSCAPEKNDSKTPSGKVHVVTADYELVKSESQEALLIMFPCMPCDAENTKAEFNIMEIAEANNISVLLMNFNQRLWLNQKEKEDLEELISSIATQHNLNTKNTYIGGFSSGGNVSILLTDYLKETKSTIQPKGLFIADSPIDLYALHKSALQTIERNFSEPAVAEANWIVEMSKRDFGVGDSALVHYTERSPYSSRTKSNRNISNLEGVKVRLYTEPDTLWWKTEKQAEYENMNAFYIEQMAEDLEKLYGKGSVELIKTENRGYRANGLRHPHSWSIIDEKSLVKWMLEKE